MTMDGRDGKPRSMFPSQSIPMPGMGSAPGRGQALPSSQNGLSSKTIPSSKGLGVGMTPKLGGGDGARGGS